MDALAASASSVSSSVRAQSLTAIVGGFSFASAIAWMDAIRWLISQVVKVQRNGGTYYLLTALFTTLLAVLAFTFINKFTKVEQPQAPIYAVR